MSGGPAVIGGILAAVGAAIALGLSLARRPAAFGRMRVAWALAGLVAVAIVGWPIAHSYLSRRYANTNPIPRIFAWARHVHHARIGIVGVVAQYPLAGLDDSNYVQYVGVSGSHGTFADAPTCPQWRQAVDRGHYDWLVLAPASFPLSTTPAPELPWTEGAPGARVALRERAAGGPPGDQAVLVHITGSLSPAACPA
jgi:hypothetical protein